MSTSTAAFVQHQTSEAKPASCTRGKHARNEGPGIKIRVIAGTGATAPRRPQHVRAQEAPQPFGRACAPEKKLAGLEGIGFGLARRERAFAVGAGTVLAAVSLAAAII